MIVVDEFSQKSGIVAIDGEHEVKAGPAVFVVENGIDEMRDIDDVTIGAHHLHGGLVNSLVEQIGILWEERLVVGHFIHLLDFLPDGILGCPDVDIGVACQDGIGEFLIVEKHIDNMLRREKLAALLLCELGSQVEDMM